MGLTLTAVNTTPLVVIEEITSVIQAIEDNYGWLDGAIVEKPDDTEGLVINFYYGLEGIIAKKLQAQTDELAYPAILLVQPFDERNIDGMKSVLFRRIIFAQKTESESQTPERENVTFKPVLRPLVKAFLKYLVANPYAMASDERKLDKVINEIPGIDPFVENSKTPVVDQIEIKNLTVTFYKSQC